MGTTLEKPTLQNLKTYPIADAFEMSKQAIAELSDRYMSLGIDPDGSGRQEVHDALMDIVKRRTGVKKTGKALRDDVNKFRSSVISFENELVDLMTPIETHLRTTRDKYDAEVERRKREAEEARQAALKAKVDELAKYGHITTTYEVDAMTDNVYAATLEEAKEAHAEKLKREAEEKAERERQEAEDAAKRKAEQEKLEAERKAFERAQSRVNKLAEFGLHVGFNAVAELGDEEFADRLAKAEADYKAKKEAESEEAARRELEAKRLQVLNNRVSVLSQLGLSYTIEAVGFMSDEEYDTLVRVTAAEKKAKEEKAEAEARKLREEREALEAEKAKIEAEKAERLRQEEQERREKEAAERAAKEERERIEREQAEAKAKEEAEEAERKRQIKLRPDREKLAAFAKHVEGLEVPEFASGQIGDAVEAELAKCAAAIREISKTL